MNNTNQTPEQQIDEIIKSFKILFLSQVKTEQEANEIERRFESLGHDAKALSAIVNDRNFYKAAIHKILSQMK